METELKKTKGLLKWLKENGHTEEEAQKEWEAAIAAEAGGLVGWLNRNGYDWHYLALHQIPSLFGLAERTIAWRKEEEEKAKRKAAEEEQKKKERNFLNNHFDEYVLLMIDSDGKLSEEELSRMMDELVEVDRIYGENRRWTRSVRSIFEVEGRFIALDWEEGLTEQQDDVFYDQPIEVEKHEYEKTIIVTEWKELKT